MTEGLKGWGRGGCREDRLSATSSKSMAEGLWWVGRGFDFLGRSWGGQKIKSGWATGTDGYRQVPVTAWQKGSEGWGGGGCQL